MTATESDRQALGRRVAIARREEGAVNGAFFVKAGYGIPAEDP